MPEHKKETLIARAGEKIRQRAFIQQHGRENLITLAELEALPATELRAKALKWQEEARAAIQHEADLVAQDASDLEVFQAKEAAVAHMKNARFITKRAQDAGISITLPDFLAKRAHLPLTNQQKLRKKAKMRVTRVKQLLEEFALIQATLDQDKDPEELEQQWEDKGLADMDEAIDEAIEKAQAAYLQLIGLGEEIEVPALLQRRIQRKISTTANKPVLDQAGEATDNDPMEDIVESQATSDSATLRPLGTTERTSPMEGVLTSMDEQSFVRRSDRIQKPPFERVMQDLGPHFDLPSYTSESGKRAGGKVSHVVLSPSQHLAVGMGSDANSQLPNAIATARQTYPQAYFKAGHLLNADLGGDGKDPSNLTILTATANSQMTAFDNPVKYALLGLYNLYKELHKDTTLDLSQFNYGIKVEIRVSDEKWGTNYPDNCIAQRIRCFATMEGKAPDLLADTRAATIHQALLDQIQLANDNGIIENTRPPQQASLSPAVKPQKRKGTAKRSDQPGRKRTKASNTPPQAESPRASSDGMDTSPAPVETLGRKAWGVGPAPRSVIQLHQRTSIDMT
ncbi:MAG TPA: hypothetical protein VFQ43_13820, partial [Nitrososphaera sp.]|nr:hypothetical protein [Nitrososphaera sp.]